jgi:hypothetical protein
VSPRLLIAAAAVGFIALVAACGGGGPDTWTRDATRECLVDLGLRPSPPKAREDFVAATATNGALAVDMRGNHATIVFGEDDDEAIRLQSAYRRFGPRDYEPPSELNRNVLIIWSVMPSDQEARGVRECLR